MKKIIYLSIIGALVLSPIAPTAQEDAATTPYGERVSPNQDADVLVQKSEAREKSYLIPAIEIPIFLFLLNRFDYHFISPRAHFDVSGDSVERNVKEGKWTIDADDFTINQIGHPYQGAVYYGFARSSGLNFWESFVYSNAGSVAWELFGETTTPSVNDQVASGVGGSFIGEALFRLSDVVISDGGENPGIMRRISAGLIYPASEMNRLFFGNRYFPKLMKRNPALYSSLRVGARNNNDIEIEGAGKELSDTSTFVDYQVEYGMPGKTNYAYKKPFDYFALDARLSANSGDYYTSAMIRGLLYGQGYEAGENYRGLWGLYGTFDYVTPQVYRLSTTGVGLGTTGNWWMADGVALQGTALAGFGFGAAGTIHGPNSETDYHYGYAPYQMLSLGFLLGDRARVDLKGRNYLITGSGVDDLPGKEKIQHLETAFSFRLYKQQAISVSYLLSRRDPDYSGGRTGSNQLIRSVAITYNLLGQPHFGSVRWGDRRT